MKIKKTICSVLTALLLLSVTGHSQQYISLTTGVNSAGNNLGICAADPQWMAAAPGTTNFQNVYCSNGNTWESTGVLHIETWVTAICGQWVTPYIYTGGGSVHGAGLDNTPIGQYDYRMYFTTNNTCPVKSAKIVLSSYGCDNELSYFSVNNNWLPPAFPNNPNTFVHLGTNYTVNIPPSQIVHGTNILDLAAINDDHYTGILLCGYLEIDYGPDTTLKPVISGNSSFCAGAPLTFTGSSGTTNINTTAWAITQCTSTGAIISGGYHWTSSSPGLPGTFTFPPSSLLTCGQYYQITLTLFNNCTLLSANKIIYINCNPTPTIGGADTVCSGSTVTLCSNYTPSSLYTESWSPRTKNLAFLNCITMTPASPFTTYTLTVTNTSTGCSGSATHTVHAVLNDPSFALTVNPVNSTYYTLAGSDIATTANTIQGFGDMWIIEELDPNTMATVYTQNTNPPCFWTFPSEGFCGFDGINRVENCSCTTYPCPCTALGKFKTNTPYRITRGTWNHYCTWAQMSYIVNYTPSGKLLSQENPVTLDNNTPDMSAMQNNISTVTDLASNVKVFPNPSKGLFTIRLENSAKGNIEVYDALGRNVKNVELNGSSVEYKLDLSDFGKGIYLFNMTIDGKRISQKVVVQ